MTRVVVVGHGMVGSRFVEDLHRRLPAAADLTVTVLGAEEYEPYNRVLLSEVVAGKVDVASLTLPSPPLPGVQVHRGREALSVDRRRRHVVTDQGAVPYDLLVLATGARARVPAVPGLGGAALGGEQHPCLPAGVHALRSLDDAREIVAATVNGPRAVVLGGGVLGLEAACGLARRGLEVTVVHGGDHLMDRQLDAAAAAAVGQTLRRLGVDQRTGTRAEEVVVRDGRVTGVRIANGDVLPAGLLVLTAGTVPETGLAGAAGLATDRGVLVDTAGSTSDARIFAVGDCAEPPEGATGLIAQGWDQARRLATR
ncbi:FAD-dependent oxidoreductase, partial [Actinotalea sp. C106]|uniref:NAD(P)/FAD-dependent oxidoreductase n=1 Tax=Actinotalea sp. C106 TaxID=2908644 RepID=UPI00202883D7